MLTFIHLSDIHFRNRDHGTQFDLDQHVRRALLDDIDLKPAGANYDGLLLTGDIAFGGQKEEYERAQEFLDELFAKSGLARERTYMVPGNHDVDRNYVLPNLPLWSSHEKLRAMTNPVEWRENLSTQLHKDPHQALLSPLHSYNYFAQGYGCASTSKNLAWSRPFPLPLEDGTVVRLHGLNSAIISDEADAPAKLLVSEFQTTHFCHAHGAVDVVLCHHPPDWLIDKAELRQSLDAFARIALFGHEHTTYAIPTKKLVQLFAGAVQPSRRDPNWLPTYHIVQLSVSGAGAARDLVVRVHTRTFSSSKGYRFFAQRNANDEPVEEHKIRLPLWEKTAVQEKAKEVATPPVGELCLTDNMAPPESLTPTPAQVAQRELLVQFFRLGTPLRFTAALEAGLVRDGDDTMEPQVMWEEVFQRAVDENRLGNFWNAVAKVAPELRAKANPFST